MSVLLGLGLATLFRQVCKGKHCIHRQIPTMDEIVGKIYRSDSGTGCVTYDLVATKCR